MTQQDYEKAKAECWEEYWKPRKAYRRGDAAEMVHYDAFSYAFDRAYALGKQEIKQEQDAEDAVIQGWVARDFDGDVFLYQNEPDRNEIAWNGYMMHSLPVDSFPNLTWDSEPEPIELVIKRKKK